MKKELLAILLVLAFVFGISFVSCDKPGCDCYDGNNNNNNDPFVPQDWDEPPIPDIDEYPDEVPDIVPSCANISDTIVDPNPDYPAYFAFKAIGTINDSKSTARPTAAFTSKFAVKLEKFATKTLKSPYIFYQDATLSDGSPAIIFNAMGDPGTKFYGTHVKTLLPVSELKNMKEQHVTIFEGAFQTQVFDIIDLNTVVRSCLIGANFIDETSKLFAGNGQICTDNNVEFAIGEIMKFGANVKLNEDPVFLMQASGVTTEAELCTCLDPISITPIDCPAEITDETTTPDE